MSDKKRKEIASDHYTEFFDHHPWLAYFLVEILSRILGIFVKWIQDEPLAYIRKREGRTIDE